MENRKAAGRPLKKNGKPEASDARSHKPAGKPGIRTEKPGLKGITKEITLLRLNRFIANSGVCSRRDADEHIKNGLISVNGHIVTDMGTKVSDVDDVRFKNKRLSDEKKVCILMNKPKDYVTTVEDPHAEHTVLELIGHSCRERVYPVGRLDKATTGVLLLTNDGDLAGKLTHPKYKRKKIYHRFKSANKRVTVSLEVPIICAISSWVRASFRRGSVFAASPFLALHSNSSFANFSPAECERPRERISRHAVLYFSLNCSATRRQASLCSLRKRRKSSRLTKFTWQGSTVSAVSS